ncbi:hypothetical protein DSO57_1015057 [Entomophthora muscae]|uniref:Uncharacterized protein n=2 Tax=Entomophthora muscae TaxID=34485 RepID=A0ACC2SIM0_9FUNG|nr:hypothetical protein DSO57_1015057 [Entomophthora muscae]
MTISTSYSSTLSQLSQYLNEVVESFENWSKIKDSIVSLKALITSAAATHANFPTDVAAIVAPLAKYINSDRTSLAKEAIDLSAHLSCMLKTGFTVHVNQFCPALIQTLGKSNKIYRSQGFAALSTIIANVKSVAVVRQICSAALSKSIIARPLGANLFQELIGSFSAQLLLQGHNDIEKVFSQGLSDPVLEIKEVFRSAFQTYVHKLPSRLDPLTKSLPKEVLKFFDRSRAMPSALTIQVATQSVKPASQVPSSVQPIKKAHSIQVGSMASSSNMASSSSSVPKHQTKPPSVQVSKNTMQASSAPSSSASACSVSSAPRLQLKRGTIINEKIPDYSHIKPKVCQGRAASVKTLPTCQRPSIVKSASIPYKHPEPRPRVPGFSRSSKYALATARKAISPQKPVPLSHTLLPNQKPAGSVCQKSSSSKKHEPCSQSLLSQKHDGHRSLSYIIPGQVANNGGSNTSQRIVGSSSHIITELPYNGGSSRSATQALQSIPDAVQVSRSTSAVICQSPEALAVPRSSTSKRPSPFSEEKDIKHQKHNSLLHR